MTEPKKPKGVQFPVDVLVKCKELKKYHPAFVRALLTEASYTKEKAIKIVNDYFNGGKS
jgi:hypothetical protein